MEWIHGHDPITIPRRRLEAITATLCSCGGRGPDDNPCDSCAIYHGIIAEASKTTVENIRQFPERTV